MEHEVNVTIGLAAYNEEAFIASTINSVLHQDYSNFRLVVADNASTDNTGEIVQQFASRDERIRYFRQAENYGSLHSLNQLAQECSTRYFVWIGAHDLWKPSFLSRCVSLLESDKSLALAYSPAILIDGTSRELGTMIGNVDTRGYSPIHRFALVLLKMPNGNAIQGLYRTEILKSTSLYRSTVSCDFVLLGELALRGAFACIDEPLWMRRETRSPIGAIEFVRRQLAYLERHTANKSVITAYGKLVWHHFATVKHELSNPFKWFPLVIIILLRYSLLVPYRWLIKRAYPVRTIPK